MPLWMPSKVQDASMWNKSLTQISEVIATLEVNEVIEVNDDTLYR